MKRARTAVFTAWLLAASLVLPTLFMCLLFAEVTQPPLDEAPTFFAQMHDGFTDPAPKVALLFLTQGSVANEGVWRAFFEGAGGLQLHPCLAGAAAAEAKRTVSATLGNAIGDRPLHPAIPAGPDYAYPGPKIQHGILSGAQRGARDTLDIKETRQRLAQSVVDAGGRFIFPVPDKELALVAADVQRLMSTSVARAPSLAKPFVSLNEGWDPWQQAASLQQVVGSLSASLRERAHSQRTPQQVQADTARCAKSLGWGNILNPLFSVYVHTQAGVLLPRSSVLSGCELAVRLNTTNGYAQHVLAEAEMLLLWAALADPLNHKFVLVSDTSIPLYPPQVIWSQLMSEQHSRLDACNFDTRTSWRYNPLMGTPNFNKTHWRKSSQWFALSKEHALLAVADSHVREMFHRFCFTHLANNAPTCVSDEHYLPSLLASYGLDNQTDCTGAAHYTDWTHERWHAKAFGATDMTPMLVAAMRSGAPSERVGHSAGVMAPAQCNAASALATAESVFLPSLAVKDQSRPSTRSLVANSLGAALVAAGYTQLGSRCSLFARKFVDGVQNQTLAMALSCSGLGLGSWCRDQDPGALVR